MKKFFFLTLALASGLMAFAQPEILVPNKADIATDGSIIAAGYVFAEGTNFSITNAFEDTYKVPGMKTNNYDAFLLDGQVISDETLTIQGQSNPLTADGGKYGYKEMKPAASGAVIDFKVNNDGYLYVFIKAMSEKAYSVFEAQAGHADAAEAIAYRYAMYTEDSLGLIHYELAAEDDYGHITAAHPILAPEDYFAPVDSIIGTGWYKIKGLGVMVFPVYKGYEYLVNAWGSKMMLYAAAFNKNASLPVSISSKVEDMENVVLFEGDEIDSVDRITKDSKAVKLVENGQLYIYKNGIRFNVLGAEVK